MSLPKGQLILVPTPLDHDLPLEPTALSRLKTALEKMPAALFCFEEIKPARRRWLDWGLPRETIEHFALLNEHVKLNANQELISILKSGRDVYLFSDLGLPAFCDPGQELVDLCHRQGIKVTATPFPNSIVLALALSGLPHETFYFAGFLPREQEARTLRMKELFLKKETVIFMDTAYRLKKCLSEFQQTAVLLKMSPIVFLGLDLNRPQELLLRGTIDDIVRQLTDDLKRDFILIFSSAN